MNITKIGHCCLLIKLNGITILTDLGLFSIFEKNDIEFVGMSEGDSREF